MRWELSSEEEEPDSGEVMQCTAQIVRVCVFSVCVSPTGGWEYQVVELALTNKPRVFERRPT